MEWLKYMIKNTVIIEIIKKAEKLLAFIGLGTILFSIFFFVSRGDSSTRMERVIQNAVDMKPLVFNELHYILDTSNLNINDLIFKYVGSSFGTKRNSMGNLINWGRYIYFMSNNNILMIVSWEENDNGIEITSIEIR